MAFYPSQGTSPCGYLRTYGWGEKILIKKPDLEIKSDFKLEIWEEETQDH